MKDNLQFNINEPHDLSSFSYNTTNQQHTPLAYDTIESTPASGNYTRKKSKQVVLSPSPRSQLFEDPITNTYKGDIKQYYTTILDNANYVRGNQFSDNYPFKKEKRQMERIAQPSPSSSPIDYLGNKANIVMVNDDPFYPYPSQKLLEDKNYWAYPHEKKYINDKPVYNYEHGLPEGTSNRIPGYKSFNPYLLEGFSNQDCNCSRKNIVMIGIFLALFLMLLYGTHYYVKRK